LSRFLVSAPGIRPAAVEAGNWLAALGLGLDKLGLDADFNRLACEVLPNGTVIAQDVRSGNRFVVRPEVEESERPVSTPSASEGGAPGRPAFKDATEPARGYSSIDLSIPPDEADTVVPDEDEEDLVAEGADDEDEDAYPMDEHDEPLEVADLDEVLPVDVAPLPQAHEDEPVDETSSSYSGPILVDGTDEDVAELDSRNLEPLLGDPLLPLADEPLPDEEEEERRVLELLEGIRSARDDIVAWQNALGVAMKLVPAEAGSALKREASGGVQFVGTEGPGAHVLRGVRLPKGIGIIGFCMDRIASIIVHDPKHDPRFYKEMDKATGFATRSVLCVPVAMEGDVFGCLELMNPPIGSSFNRIHIELVELVAGTLADRLVTGRPLL